MCNDSIQLIITRKLDDQLSFTFTVRIQSYSRTNDIREFLLQTQGVIILLKFLFS